MAGSTCCEGKIVNQYRGGHQLTDRVHYHIHCCFVLYICIRTLAYIGSVTSALSFASAPWGASPLYLPSLNGGI